MPNKKKENEWEKKLRDSTKIRLLGLLMIVYALQLINDEKGIDSAVENFIKGNKALVKTLLSTQKKEMIEEVEKMKVDLREKNEMLPNVYHRCKGYNQAISNILQKMKEGE